MTEQIIITEEQRSKLAEYKDEAFAALSAMEEAKQHLKDIVESAAEVTLLKKAQVSKHFKTMFNDDLDKMIELVENLKFLQGKE